ncbi:MAG: hypothetical protein Ct9H300mP15_00180 [Gemmatimonadota bacterium]|nr:MAG: hypothetical protein Ct9H300mP15_00180 [Gemmatimonadota bacterium]
MGTEMRSLAEIDNALEMAGVSEGQHMVVYAPILFSQPEYL